MDKIPNLGNVLKINDDGAIYLFGEFLGTDIYLYESLVKYLKTLSNRKFILMEKGDNDSVFSYFYFKDRSGKVKIEILCNGDIVIDNVFLNDKKDLIPALKNFFKNLFSE